MPNKSGSNGCSKGLPFPKPGDEVVISGIAGRFPESHNVAHFRENLFNKVDLITDDDRRWKLENSDIPKRTGKVNDIDRFDAQFFGINFKEAHTMDPMARMLLEHTYEAIIDAGVNPVQLRGTRTGVFVGTCCSESENDWMYTTLQVRIIETCSILDRITYNFTERLTRTSTLIDVVASIFEVNLFLLWVIAMPGMQVIDSPMFDSLSPVSIGY
ncbi:fatty acid synthase-like [Neodiprion virginianus]|uniref:fatty acid synthase-like n=1 Tax=Neodiprion virginianus TaxID=2961670 RepID=UPI001EE6B09A|nr:fatty acid synthase-like [Neodiprion virginianus]